ncbi:hypothetical protein Tco_1013476, partial [Tanacetum coccineum]
KKMIKEQVKVQVKEQVSKILPRIEKSVNEQLEAEVLIRSSNEAKTSHVVAANLSELELKKILIDKIENNKSIDRSVQQKNLYKALVDAYESDKDILTTYGDTVTLKRRRDDKDEDEEPSAGSNRGSKRRRAGKEPESTSAPKEKSSKSTKEGSKSYQKSTGFTEDQPIDETTQLPDWFQKPIKPPTPDCDWNKTLLAIHGLIQPWISTLAWNEDPYESFNELMDTPLDFSTFVLNWLKVDTLTLELLAGPTLELMKGSCNSLVELEYFLKEGRKRQQFYGYAVNRESAHDVYSRNRIIRIKKLTIVEWHNYKHLEWITIRRDDDKLYTFKEGDYNRLRLQDIEDMLLLLVQGKLTNLNIEERLALGVSLRMFTRSTVIRRRVEDLQLGIESYQKKLNLTKLDTLMRIDELHKFSDGTLNDVRSAFDDIQKRIRMKYLPQTIWRNVDKERARAMIQAIDQQLRNKRIIRSLEKFVEHQSDTQVIIMKMEILLEPTSNKLMVDPHGFEGYFKMEVKAQRIENKAKTVIFRCYVSKWVPLADMADDVAATLAMTWQVGPIRHLAVAGQLEATTWQILTCQPAGIRGTRFGSLCNHWSSVRGSEEVSTRFGDPEPLIAVRGSRKQLLEGYVACYDWWKKEFGSC